MSAPRIVVTCLVITAGPPAFAADAERARQCVGIEEAGARLACYDSAFGRVTAAGQPVPAGSATETSAATSTTPGSAAAAAASTAAASPASASAEAARAVEEFGLTDTAKRARDPEKAKETMPESISAGVTQVGWRPTGEVVVTLDNGQVWEQAETVTTQARVKVGDVVTIRKAALGSYTLRTASKAAVRVRRLR